MPFFAILNGKRTEKWQTWSFFILACPMWQDLSKKIGAKTIDLKKLSHVCINRGNAHICQKRGKKYYLFYTLNFQICSCIRRYIIVYFGSNSHYLRSGNFFMEFQWFDCTFPWRQISLVIYKVSTFRRFLIVPSLSGYLIPCENFKTEPEIQ